ncbi:hypothetical protein ALC60_08206 [Trachymyrmex zeteki]|uniref:Uncharacterized protein n=1 Tax=Mycetomoellerius zeteki TaxID=64791 RepID=A0A151WXS4_9HYME|nr:hypothetical protein ALC60_08206 [Trachymyrmex zeteki]
MVMNPKNIVSLLQQNFNRPEYDIHSVITDEERSFAVYLEDLIKESIDTRIFIETFDTLCYYIMTKVSTVPFFLYSMSTSIIAFLHKKAIIDVDIEYKKKAVEYWRSGKTNNVPLKSVQHRFRKVSSLKLLYRWEAQIIQSGIRIGKLLQISKYVLATWLGSEGTKIGLFPIRQ